MQKHLLHLLSLSLLALMQLPAYAQQPVQAPTTGKADTVRTDAEYDRYRQSGDSFFKVGRYDDARRQYRNCLEVPGFDNDPYATQRIDLTTRCLALLQQADDAVQQQKPAEIVNRLTDVLALNPTDPLVNNRLADSYLAEGNNFFQQKRYSEAKGQYQQGIPFAQVAGNRTMLNTLDLQLRNSTVTYVTPKRTVLKVLMGVLAAGSGYYAYTLQNDFTTKQKAFNAIALSTDPDGDGVVNLPDEYQRYNAAYTEVEAAQSKRGLYTACVAVAAAATVTELYLLLRKAKPRQVIGFHLKPSSVSHGLAIGYRF